MLIEWLFRFFAPTPAHRFYYQMRHHASRLQKETGKSSIDFGRVEFEARSVLSYAKLLEEEFLNMSENERIKRLSR